MTDLWVRSGPHVSGGPPDPLVSRLNAGESSWPSNFLYNGLRILSMIDLPECTTIDYSILP